MQLKYFALAIGIVACSETRTPATTGPLPEPGKSTLVARLIVTGEAAAGLSSYDISVNGSKLIHLAPNSNTSIQLEPGAYQIMMTGFDEPFFSELMPMWCSPVGALSFNVIAEPDKVVELNFTLDCPALSGDGILALTFYESNATRSANVPLTFTRLNGAPMTRAASAPPGEETSVTLPPGLWRMTIGSAGSCSPSPAYAVFGFPILRVANQRVLRSSYAMTCI